MPAYGALIMRSHHLHFQVQQIPGCLCFWEDLIFCAQAGGANKEWQVTGSTNENHVLYIIIWIL